MSEPTHQQVLEWLSRELIERGKLIEAGWVSLRIAAVPADAPQVQLDEMRNAFFAGAQHLYASIMTTLDPGDEPTDADFRRMGLIDDELQSFAHDLERRISGTEQMQ